MSSDSVVAVLESLQKRTVCAPNHQEVAGQLWGKNKFYCKRKQFYPWELIYTNWWSCFSCTSEHTYLQKHVTEPSTAPSHRTIRVCQYQHVRLPVCLFEGQNALQVITDNFSKSTENMSLRINNSRDIADAFRKYWAFGIISSANILPITVNNSQCSSLHTYIAKQTFEFAVSASITE